MCYPLCFARRLGYALNLSASRSLGELGQGTVAASGATVSAQGEALGATVSAQGEALGATVSAQGEALPLPQ